MSRPAAPTSLALVEWTCIVFPALNLDVAADKLTTTGLGSFSCCHPSPCGSIRYMNLSMSSGLLIYHSDQAICGVDSRREALEWQSRTSSAI